MHDFQKRRNLLNRIDFPKGISTIRRMLSARFTRENYWKLGALVFFACAACSMAKPAISEPLIITQIPQSLNHSKDMRNEKEVTRNDLFEQARIVLVAPDGETKKISNDFYSACDPSVSFDGKRILFAGKKTHSDHWRIYEMSIDGSGVRAVTPEGQEARQPIYLSTLFTLDSPEPWFTLAYIAQDNYYNEAGRLSIGNLYNIRLDGAEIRRLTYNPNNHYDPFQTWDGRIIYSAERYALEPSSDKARAGIFSIHMEGADMEFYGGASGDRIQRMPCATERGLIIFVESEVMNSDGAGQLGCFEERLPHTTYKKLTSDPEWQYLHPTPYRNNCVLVSRRHASGNPEGCICLYDADTGSCDVVFDDPKWNDAQAQRVRPRPRPDGHSTIVEPAKYTTGVFYAMNCYNADEKMRPYLKKGAFKRVRVIEGLPIEERNSGRSMTAAITQGLDRKGPYIIRRVLGEAPIESDGSFNIEVPADTPILLQTLDERGLSLGTCGWIWVKPRETRGCIGCHEDPELIPENDFVFALRRLPTKINPPPSQKRNVDFCTTVVPILKNRCASVSCHGRTGAPIYLPLMADKPAMQDLQQAYAALLSAVEGGPGKPGALPKRGKYIDTGRARTSPLIWRLYGLDTSRPWDGAGGQKTTGRKPRMMPPLDNGGPLSDEEIRTLVEWIDLGAAWKSDETELSGNNLTH
jgi:hypothetical protein